MLPKQESSPKTGKEVVASLDSLFHKLTTMDKRSSSEETILLNESIRRTVESIRTSNLLTEIDEIYAQKKHDFTFTLSKDKKLGIFSWHTKMDATGNRIKNIALYNTGSSIQPSSLYDTPVTYDGIHQVKSLKGENLYILHGYINSGDSHYSRLNAYILKSGYLEEAPAFPNNESSISIAQIQKNPKFSDSLGFKIEMNGSRILFPEIRSNSIIQHSLAFNGKRYIREQRND